MNTKELTAAIETMFECSMGDIEHHPYTTVALFGDNEQQICEHLLQWCKEVAALGAKQIIWRTKPHFEVDQVSAGPSRVRMRLFVPGVENLPKIGD